MNSLMNKHTSDVWEFNLHILRELNLASRLFNLAHQKLINSVQGLEANVLLAILICFLS